MIILETLVVLGLLTMAYKLIEYIKQDANK